MWKEILMLEGVNFGSDLFEVSPPSADQESIH